MPSFESSESLSSADAPDFSGFKPITLMHILMHSCNIDVIDHISDVFQSREAALRNDESTLEDPGLYDGLDKAKRMVELARMQVENRRRKNSDDATQETIDLYNFINDEIEKLADEVKKNRAFVPKLEI